MDNADFIEYNANVRPSSFLLNSGQEERGPWGRLEAGGKSEVCASLPLLLSFSTQLQISGAR